MHIRPLSTEDLSAVRQLMQDCSFIDTDFKLESPEYPNLIAEVNKAIVGVAIKGPSGPHWVEITVIVHSDYRRQGLATRLHEALLRAKPSELDIDGWNGACYAEDHDAIGFMQAMGYKNRLDCNILELDLNLFVQRPELPIGFEHLKIASFTELFEVDMRQEIFDFLVSRYIDNHYWSPPVPKEHPAWSFVLEELRPELSFALLDDQKIVAASSVLDENINVLDMCWYYASLEYAQENAQALLRFLLAHQFREALKVGLTQANLELDSIDRDKQGLLEWLPVQKQRIWKIFQKAL